MSDEDSDSDDLMILLMMVMCMVLMVMKMMMIQIFHDHDYNDVNIISKKSEAMDDVEKQLKDALQQQVSDNILLEGQGLFFIFIYSFRCRRSNLRP